VAVSWAVPNGIPQHPGENRKAVHTEDHPLKYLDWEGTIPEGEYGAGIMKVWDSGTYEAEKWEEAKVVVVFRGERVRGRYALFRAGSDADWMIHRMDPAEPGRQPMPERVTLARAVAGELPGDEGHAFEVDWPGMRVAVYCKPGRIRIETARGEDVTERFPEVRGLSRALGARSAIFDGVLVGFGRDGRPDPGRLERRLREGTTATYARRAKEAPVVLAIVDLLHLDGGDLTAEPWAERRAAIEGLGLDGPSWHVPAAHLGDGAEFLAATRAQGLPGVIAKRADAPYGSGWTAVGREDARRVEITHPERALYPQTGFTKADLARYYEAVAPVLLPHLRDRPIAMRRYFHGVDGPKRWEKECPPQAPDWLARAPIHSDDKGRDIDYCVLQDLPSLMWSANHANIELHPLLARHPRIEQPTALVLDLDPGEGATLEDCRAVALILHGMFDQLGLENFVKTSGGKGLHFYVPAGGDQTYDATRPFARQVAELIAQREPERVTAEMSKARRRGKVFIDWSQNDWFKSTVAVYSLRARDEPSVSTPVTWDEVESGELEFGPSDVLERIEEHGDLFAPLLSLEQALPV